jgi:hypothetical protein
MLNGFSDLTGTWQIQSSDETISILTFELPDSFSLVVSEEGMSATHRGTWIYNPEDETVVCVGLDSPIVGKNRIISQSEDYLELENKGVAILAKKMATDNSKIERLGFSEDDFYDENGDYKYYDDFQKLPWQDSFQMLTSLLNVDQLVYNYSTLIEGTDAFKSKTLTADVVANDEEQSLSIDFIFYGYDRYNLPDDTELPPNENYTEPLFPLKDVSYRVMGKEQITLPAGTFDCTVVEALGDFDELMKFWMIDDKPGIYAKIIGDKAGSFGHFRLYELQEIKNKVE